MENCLSCEKPIDFDPEVNDFCSPACEAEYVQACRETADFDHWSGGVVDTPRLDPPHWHYH